MGRQLRRIAEDVWRYTTGECTAGQRGDELEQAGAEFKRAAAPVVERLNAIEQRERQYQRMKELERGQRQRGFER